MKNELPKCPVSYCHGYLTLIDEKREVISFFEKEDWVVYHTHWKCSECKGNFVDHSSPRPEKRNNNV